MCFFLIFQFVLHSRSNYLVSCRLILDRQSVDMHSLSSWYQRLVYLPNFSHAFCMMIISYAAFIP